MRFTTAVLAGALLGVALLICGVSLSLWLFPLGSLISMSGLSKIEKAISFQSYLMLPLLSAGVGLVSRVVGIRWCGLAGAVAVLPVVAVFVSGNSGSGRSVGIGAIFLALAWLTAQAAGGAREGFRLPEAFSPRKLGLVAGRLLGFLRRRKPRHNSSDGGT